MRPAEVPARIAPGVSGSAASALTQNDPVTPGAPYVHVRPPSLLRARPPQVIPMKIRDGACGETTIARSPPGFGSNGSDQPAPASDVLKGPVSYNPAKAVPGDNGSTATANVRPPRKPVVLRDQATPEFVLRSTPASLPTRTRPGASG